MTNQPPSYITYNDTPVGAGSAAPTSAPPQSAVMTGLQRALTAYEYQKQQARLRTAKHKGRAAPKPHHTTPKISRHHISHGLSSAGPRSSASTRGSKAHSSQSRRATHTRQLVTLGELGVAGRSSSRTYTSHHHASIPSIHAPVPHRGGRF